MLAAKPRPAAITPAPRITSRILFMSRSPSLSRLSQSRLFRRRGKTSPFAELGVLRRFRLAVFHSMWSARPCLSGFRRAPSRHHPVPPPVMHIDFKRPILDDGGQRENARNGCPWGGACAVENHDVG